MNAPFQIHTVILMAVVIHGLSCGQGLAAEGDVSADLKPNVYVLTPGEDFPYKLQSRLIDAVPGDVIQLEAGHYQLKRQLDVVADNITIRGRGAQATVLSFEGQSSGGQGLEATGDNFVLEQLAIENTAGNAVKVLGAKNVTFRGVRVEWTGEPSSSNGAYGIYPVQCENVLLEDCTAIGASDAGLYVGQCRNVVVRRCRAERNVAGIEIENTVGADVYENVATNNAGGILVFDMPGLQLKAGRNVRVYRNDVRKNNHPNFADPGAIVAAVPPGTGCMVMASDHVEIFENQIHENHSASLLIVSYLAMDRKINDPTFDAIPEHISVHDNQISGGGTKPAGVLSELLGAALGVPLPDILWDGVRNPESKEITLGIRDNGKATFADFNLMMLSPENVQAGKYVPVRELTTVSAQLKRLPAVELAAHAPPTEGASLAARVYRTLPKRLSEFGLFKEPLAQHQPAAGVLPYDLNTQLFSDFAEKRRFIQLPKGTQMAYDAEGVFTFPVGTVIAKTFSYPHDLSNPSQGERLVETRIEFLRDEGWYGITYVWNDEQTEAFLALGGSETDVSWIQHDGQRVATRYEIPNANQCLNCHNQDKAYIPIGPTARNLNRPYGQGKTTRSQLADWAHAGVLAHLPETASIPAVPRFEDTSTAPLADRARAWLDVNCAHCHNPSGTARTSGLDLRWGQHDLAKVGVWKAPVAAGHGSGGRMYDIVPGKPDESILVYRLESTDPSIMMPNVGRHLVQSDAVDVVRAWIAAMPITE